MGSIGSTKMATPLHVCIAGNPDFYPWAKQPFRSTAGQMELLVDKVLSYSAQLGLNRHSTLRGAGQCCSEV
jgi:hypothetical protein